MTAPATIVGTPRGTSITVRTRPRSGNVWWSASATTSPTPELEHERQKRDRDRVEHGLRKTADATSAW